MRYSAWSAVLVASTCVAACGGRTGLAHEAPATADAGVDAAESCTLEECDGLDDDCDGRVDEGLAQTLFPDADRDGFGDAMNPREACPSPTLVADGSDCDDRRADVSPTAAEECEDGIDNDCDGYADCFDDDCGCTPPPPVVEDGRYFMGSPTSEEGREEDEALHEVEITRPFVMMATEVTQGEWRALTGTSPSHFAACGDDCPVESVSWHEAIYFANLLSEADGYSPCYTLRECHGEFGAGCSVDDGTWTDCRADFFCWVDLAVDSEMPGLLPACDGWRLPTEAEWEYAARAGSRGAFSIGDDIERVSEIGWCTSNGENTTHPVAQFPANPWGLHDMAGNVYEWVWDSYADYPMEPQVDPLGPWGDGTGRVMRGGSMVFGDFACRSANRGARNPANRESIIGVRLVRTLAE